MLQNIFYTLAIIYLSLGIIMMILLGIAILYVLRTLEKIKVQIKEKVDSIQSLTSHPGIIARGVGSLIADAFSFGFQRLWKRI